MGSRMEIGRIAGIPIVLDFFFLVVILAFTSRYFLSGDTQLMSAGLLIVAGLAASVLLHELGHALAGLVNRVGVDYIELNGLGGICHFTSSLPRGVAARTVIHLAGPAANLALWQLFDWLSAVDVIQTKFLLVRALDVLAWANFYLMLFNLLPAFPLDGGHTLETWLSALFGYKWGVRIVGGLGLLVAVGIGFQAVPSMSLFMILLAVLIWIANWAALTSAGGFGRWR